MMVFCYFNSSAGHIIIIIIDGVGPPHSRSCWLWTTRRRTGAGRSPNCFLQFYLLCSVFLRFFLQFLLWISFLGWVHPPPASRLQRCTGRGGALIIFYNFIYYFLYFFDFFTISFVNFLFGMGAPAARLPPPEDYLMQARQISLSPTCICCRHSAAFCDLNCSIYCSMAEMLISLLIRRGTYTYIPLLIRVRIWDY